LRPGGRVVDTTTVIGYIASMGRTRLPLSEQVRRAIDNCGHSRYRISKATGIDDSTLSRFMTRERGLPMKTLDRLAEYLDLNIVAGKPKGTVSDATKKR
jgi:transcriptional regulator with XRE-family HTH domain